MKLLTPIDDVPASLAGLEPSHRPPMRIAALQHRWPPDRHQHIAPLTEGVRMAAADGARVVCLQEFALSPNFAVMPGDHEAAGVKPKPLPGGPTYEFAAATNVFGHASLYDAREDDPTVASASILPSVWRPTTLVARTRTLHGVRGPGYHKDHYLRPRGTGYPVGGAVRASTPSRCGSR
jgi:N-carbamoylputrescine amidase